MKALLEQITAKMNRKGIAPLISTIILLVFATGLGLVVMNWGNAVSIAHEDGCDAQLDVVRINGVAQACYAENTVRLTIENTGLETASEMKIAIIDEHGIINQVMHEEIAFIEVREIAVLTQRTLSDIRKIKITPKTEEYCPGKALEIDEVRRC